MEREADPAKLAEDLRERMAAIGVSLAYHRESVARLAGYLEHNRAALLAEQTTWLPLLGAFVGQCLAQQFGGRWEVTDQGEVQGPGQSSSSE